MIKRAVKFLKVLGLSLILISSIFALSGCATKEFTYGRVSTLTYRVNVFLKEGERLEEITLYLPFPRHKGVLMPQVMKSAQQQLFEEYKIESRLSEEAVKKVSLDIVNTQYGKMLKIHATNLKERGGFSFEGSYMYARFLPAGDASKEYPLEPVSSKEGQERSYIYIGRKEGSGFYLHLFYGVGYEDQYIPHGSGLYPGRGKSWVIARVRPDPEERGIDPSRDRLEITAQGWAEVPVWSREH